MDVRDITSKNNRITHAAVFGAGNYGRTLTRGLQKYCGVTVEAICDNDDTKWGVL